VIAGPGRSGVREWPFDGMLDRHIAILQRLQALSTELIELSSRETASLSDAEIEALTGRLDAIRTEIARLREEFKETLN
jgi:predicted nuclease with TOPRIM domain